MKILELLLPKGIKDADLTPKAAERIDMLHKRMNKYVDKISDPSTSQKGKEFLKAKLKQDYDELKDVIETVTEHIVKTGGGYRLVSHTGKNLGDFESHKAAAKHEGEVEYFKSHPKEGVAEAEGDPEGVPHLTKTILTHIVQQIGTEGAHAIVKSLEWGDGAAKELLQLITKDLKNNISMAESVKQRLDPSCWSGYKKSGTKMKGGVRVNNCVKNEDVNALPSKDTDAKLTEAVHKLPLSDSDFELVKQLMLHRIPAAVAPIYIQEIIDDDEFNSMLSEFADMNPSMDVRPHVVEWIRRVMPDQMYRFDDSGQTLKQRLGQTSVIHGYDPHMYHGSNDPITGNAYGRA